MIKVEAVIEEVVSGAITKLRVGDDVYALVYIGRYQDVEAGEQEVYPEHSEQEKRKMNRRYRRRKPEGVIGKSKTYKSWIKEKDHDKILGCLKTNPLTTKELVKETGMSITTIRSVLSYMLENKEIQKRFHKETLEPLYGVV